MPKDTGNGPFTSAEVNALFERWQRDRDERAREALVNRFLPLAKSLARRYMRSNEPYDDLVQVASLGLVKAIERFDHTRGFAFTSFAVPTIVGELKRYFRDTGWALHVDRSAQERARKIIDAEARISAEIGRSPTVVELGQYLEMSDEDVLEGLETAEAYEALSLDAPVQSGEGEASSRGDLMGGDDESFGRVETQASLFAAARHLTKRERQIIFLRFEEDLTQSEIAARVGISQMQVSRLLRQSLKRMRELTDAPPGYE